MNTPDTIDKILAAASTALVPTLLLIGGWAAGYFSSYMNKKGENLATHEDIDKLVKQVAAVTKTTKEIESKISDEVWDRQRQWEMKRDVLFEATRRLATFDDELLSYSILMRQDYKKREEWESSPPSPDGKLSWLEMQSDGRRKWNVVSRDFDESRALITAVCCKETAEAFNDLGSFVNKLAADVTRGADVYDGARLDLFKKMTLAQKAVRKELGVDGQA
jgi:hypothetical protein